MANILDRYGIKEVADVTFYELTDGVPQRPVLFLDTLKVSTIEQTAESADAKGGKGNTALISWDYGKEINVTLEDALFSAKSMAIMFGNGEVKDYNDANSYIMKTETFKATGTTVPTQGTSSSGWSCNYEGPDGKLYAKINPKFYAANGTTASALVVGDTYFCTFDIAVNGSVIEVGASTFPGTYYVTGDTFARSEKDGKDEFFQFIIPKAKVQSSNTITLQADGDPSTFSMSLKVLRPADGKMMKLVKYNATGAQEAQEADLVMVHNHSLDPVTATFNPLSVSVSTSDTETGVDVTLLNAGTNTIAATPEAGAKISATVAADKRKVTIKAVSGATAGVDTYVNLTQNGKPIGKITVKIVAPATNED